MRTLAYVLFGGLIAAPLFGLLYLLGSPDGSIYFILGCVAVILLFGRLE